MENIITDKLKVKIWSDEDGCGEVKHAGTDDFRINAFLFIQILSLVKSRKGELPMTIAKKHSISYLIARELS